MKIRCFNCLQNLDILFPNGDAKCPLCKVYLFKKDSK